MKSARYTLGLLLVIYVVNHIDRQVMYILADDIKADLALSDGQLGFLIGGGFAMWGTVFSCTDCSLQYGNFICTADNLHLHVPRWV